MMELIRRKPVATAADIAEVFETGAERRRCVRQASLLEVAKLTIGGKSELCRLRDVSASGLRAELYCPVQPDERVSIELRTGHVIEGTIAWAAGGDMGVSFDATMPITEMLSHCSFDERVTTVRAPRLDISVEATLLAQRFKQPAHVVNISQSGCKLLLDDMFEADTPCVIAIEHIGPINGEIKWWRDREGGLMFDEPIPYTKFAAWRRAMNPQWRVLDGPHVNVNAWVPPVETVEVSGDVEAAPRARPTRLFGARGGKR